MGIDIKKGIEIKKEFNKYRLFLFAYWAMMLSMTGMYTMYIVHIGYSKLEISFTVTLFTISTLAGQNFIGYLADRFGCVKKILILSTSVGIFIAVALQFSQQNWYVNIMIALWAFFLYGSFPLTEAWCIGFLRASGDQKDFGKIRGFGSIGYGLSGVLLGVLLQSAGWKIYYWYILLGVCMTLVTLFLIREDSRAAFYKPGSKGGGESGDISFGEAILQIIRNKPLRFVIILVFLYTFVVKGIYNYLGVFLTDFGGGPMSLGFTYFFDASPEIITFFLTSRLLSKYRSKNLIFVAFLLQVIRLSLILVFNSSLAIILLGCLSGFAFGLLASAYKTYIYELAPEKYKISSLSLSESFIGMAGVASAPIFGFFITSLGVYATIGIGLAVDVIAVGFLLWDMIKEKTRGGVPENMET